MTTTNKKDFKVDFIGIGSGRCATTWIYQCLKEHSEVCMSKPKETAFFLNQNFRKKDYRSFFTHCSSGDLKGEFTPRYMFGEGVAANIRKHNPEVKLIACFRDPIKRAHSAYLYDVNRGGGGVEYESFDEAVRSKNNAYVEYGKYYSYLQDYLDTFPRENILILIYENIEKDPEEFVRRIYEFLEVESDFRPPSLDERVNETRKCISRKVAKKIHRIEDVIRRNKNNVVMKPFYYLLKRSNARPKLRKLIRFLNSRGRKSEARHEVDPATRKFLKKEFQEEVKQLEEIVDKDLSYWK